MALILNIDTATDYASIALCNNGQLIALKDNPTQKEHAAFVHVAIEGMLKEHDVSINTIDAFAVTSGPGSYTGLRVSMAAAKGLCYALQKPLICINTLQVMACAAKKMIIEKGLPVSANQLLCPMIDARRMEVFMAIYNMDMVEIEPTIPKILTEEFLQYVENKHFYFFGNGSKKIFNFKQNILNIIDVVCSASHLGILSEEYFKQKRFSEVIYSEPQYFKEFYSGVQTVEVK